MIRRPPPAVIALLLLAGSSGCFKGSPVEDTWYTVRSVAGDTSVVRTVGAISQSATIALDEGTVVGRELGAGRDWFGEIANVLPAPGGGVIVGEVVPHRIRHFDSAGLLLRTYMNEDQARGEGPEMSLMGPAIASDDSGLVYHWTRRAISVYDSGGTRRRQIALTIPGMPGITPVAGYIDSAGVLITHFMGSAKGAGGRAPEALHALVLMRRDGTPTDTAEGPAPFGERIQLHLQHGDSTEWMHVPLSPAFHVAATVHGEWVYGTSELYVIHVYSERGSRVRIESDLPATATVPQERRDLAANATLQARTIDPAASIPEILIPEQKPIFKGLFTDSNARIWVWLHTAARRQTATRCITGLLANSAARKGCPAADSMPVHEWVEPQVFQVFGRTGEFLGRLELPEHTEWRAAAGEALWLVRTADSGGRQELVRFRMTLPEGGRQ